MKRKTKILFLIIVLLTIVGGLVFYLLHTNNVVENVKRQLAYTFEYEYIPNQQLAIEATQVFYQKDSLYQDFRKKYRFHYQIIGVGTFSDSSKLILLAEPPPHFEIDTLRSIVAKFNCQIEVKQHKIGYDGKVSDLLILFANATEENIQNIVKQLTEVVFLSAYKPFHIVLPVEDERKYFAKNNLDLQISLSEFEEWFLDEGEEFFNFEDTNKVYNISTLLEKKKKGVYFSKIPGFVAWVIDKKESFDAQIQFIRSFTLDSDIILGGFSDSSALIIIGRERESFIHELPPLRVETILLLASITDKELSQSLDVNDFLAGKMPDGKDWCPTYLSKELENTEFGHLMTITDVLLKNWSESGTIKEAFYRYPSPGYYPFDQPLFKKLGLSELVYNWNTTNAMYAIDLENITIYSLNRTGSLPVSYFVSPDRSTSVGRYYEQRAYNYFARLSNTDLVRVVQYTALYQMFIDNDIHYGGEVFTSFPKNKPYLLLNPTKSLLTILKTVDSDMINQIADTIARKQFTEIQKDKVVKQMTSDESKYQFQFSEEEKRQIFKNVVSQQEQDIAQKFRNVRRLLNQLSDEDFEKIAKYLAYPRGVRINDQESYQRMLKAKEINGLLRSIGKNNLALLGFDLKEVRDFFVNNLSKSSAKYLKTPSIIQTFNDFYTTGGHNLSSKISRVKQTTNYKQTTYVSEPSHTPSVPSTTPKSSPSVAKEPATPSQQPKASRPTPLAPKASTTKSTTARTQQPQRSSTSTGRPRSEVISTTARTQRGF